MSLANASAWAMESMQLPGISRTRATSDHPLLIGASPGTTGTMSLYYALMTLGVSTVHYSRQFNASSGTESTSYGQDPPGGPVDFLQPLFRKEHPAPPVDLSLARSTDLRFFSATEALLDTPGMELLFDLLATFPNARVLISSRDPLTWARSRRSRHPGDRVPMFELLGFDVAMAQLSEEQAATAFVLWHKAVTASVPRERLLVVDLFQMRSEELWDRLAEFVGKPSPRAPDGSVPPFPHLHYGEDMLMRRTVSPEGSPTEPT